MYYYNNNLKCMYFTTARNGSGIIDNIHRSVDYLKHITSREFVSRLVITPEIPIYTGYRNPKIRYFSGLFMHHSNRFNYKGNELHIDDVRKTVSEMYRSAIKIYKNNEWILMPNYGLNDVHLEHTLIFCFILHTMEYNLKMIELDQWGKTLSDMFPECAKKISSSGRSDSSTRISESYQSLSEEFLHQLEIQKPTDTTERICTLEEWMAPEETLYDYLHNISKNQNTLLQPQHLIKDTVHNNYLPIMLSTYSGMVGSLIENFRSFDIVYPWFDYIKKPNTR